MVNEEHLSRVRIASTTWARLLPKHYASIICFRSDEIALKVMKYPRSRHVRLNHTDRYNYWPFQFELFEVVIPA